MQRSSYGNWRWKNPESTFLVLSTLRRSMTKLDDSLYDADQESWKPRLYLASTRNVKSEMINLQS